MDSKLTLTIGAVFKAMLAASAAIGFYGFIGIPTNWLAIQVFSLYNPYNL